MTPIIPQPARVPGSFRDPSGFVFAHDGKIFRQVNKTYQEQYDLLHQGLYQALTDSGRLVRHEELQRGPGTHPDAYRILQPEPIPFISYPYEWSFSQLKDAALTTLEVQKKALDFGMTLKDASAYNIQFLRGRPVFIDSLSFEIYREGEPWVAYKQFCEHFLAPLALMAYRDISLGQLSRVHIDGVPISLAHALLPIRTRLKPSLQMHIHMHSKFQDNSADRPESKLRTRKAFSLRAFRGLVDSLESTTNQLKWNPGKTEWADYENDDSYSDESLDHKKKLVAGFIKEARPDSLWDLGANTGTFSRLASAMGINTVSFDKDPSAVEMNYLAAVAREETSILPLLIDLTNPSPMIGWANRERMDLFERGPADMVLGLALIHHLAISENVPLGMIADFCSRLANWAVIEFVPKGDKKVDRLFATREDIFPDFNLSGFEYEFSQRFEIITRERIAGSVRTLYFMKSKRASIG
jgi:ribosomal protein L11 methylase PrmA